MLPSLPVFSISKYKRQFHPIYPSVHDTIKASWMWITYCVGKVMRNSKRAMLSLFVHRIRLIKDFPYIPLKTRVEKKVAFFLKTKRQKCFIVRVHTAKKKTMNCMHCCAICAKNRQQAALRRISMRLLKRLKTTKGSGACICH